MSVFGSLKFWKKEEEFPADELIPGIEEKPVIPEQPEAGLPPHLEESWGTAPSAGLRSVQSVSSRDIELISSKLDAIRAILSSVEQRVMNIERTTMNQQQPPQRKMPW